MEDKKNKRQRSEATSETIEQIREAFKTTEIKRVYTTSEVIKTLKADILRMRKEGMSLAQISEILGAHGVKASTTLISRIVPAEKQKFTSIATEKKPSKNETKQKTNKQETSPAQKQNKIETKTTQSDTKNVEKKNNAGFDLNVDAADEI